VIRAAAPSRTTIRSPGFCWVVPATAEKPEPRFTNAVPLSPIIVSAKWSNLGIEDAKRRSTRGRREVHKGEPARLRRGPKIGWQTFRYWLSIPSVGVVHRQCYIRHNTSFAVRRLARAQVLLAVSPFILDHSASCASLFCCRLSASRLSCSLDHQAKHVSPIINAGTSPFCSSRRREVPLLITMWPRQSLM
jgi:hypothetical protein